MNRMHPQDLRAIMAAIMKISPNTVDGIGERFRPHYPDTATAFEMTDNLLAELERTAKPVPEPEPEKHWSYWQKRCDKAEAALADAAKAERERIIAMMVAWDGNERVYNTRGRFDALALRAALEPKP